MPHLAIDCSENPTPFDPAACLAEANVALVASGQFQAADIRSRARRIATFRVGHGPSGRAFIAARLSIRSGRSLATRQDLSQRVPLVLKRQVATGTGLSTQVSVEVLDIDRATYAKGAPRMRGRVAAGAA